MKVSDYSHTGHEIAQAVLLLCGTPNYFLDNVFNYPTLAECYQVAGPGLRQSPCVTGGRCRESQ